jgi:hypothetical protein
MNSINKRNLIFSGAGIVLAIVFLFMNLNLLSGPQNSSRFRNKASISEKKATILPIIVIGGLQFFRKTFEKK